MCLQGIQDMLLQYLQLVMGFNATDQAVLITAVGAGTFVVQVGGSGWLALGVLGLGVRAEHGALQLF
jgi:hypothetical protein